jgi:hypothetical protein
MNALAVLDTIRRTSETPAERDAIDSVFGWLARDFKRKLDEKEKGTLRIGASVEEYVSLYGTYLGIVNGSIH